MLQTLTFAEETTLVAACRAGDERAWARLYALAAPKVRVFLRRSVGADADLDDLCQQVFIEFFASIGRFRGDARVSTWLYRIASHVAAKAWRTRGRHMRKVEALAVAQGTAPGVAASPSDTLDAQRLVEAVDAVLAGLKPALRTVWVLSMVEGLAPHEIAEVIEAREGTARSQLTKARRVVLEGLARRGVTLPAQQTTPPRPIWPMREEESSS